MAILTLVSDQLRTSAIFKELELWAQSISDLSGGVHSIRLFGPGELVGAFESFDAVSSGQVDLALLTPVLYTESSAAFPAATAFAIPGVSQTGVDASLALTAAFNTGSPEAAFAASGLDVLSAAYSEPYVLVTNFFNSALNTDIEGLKIVVQEPSLQFFFDTEANPLIIPNTELFQALATGVVDGAVVPASLALSLGLNEVAPFVYALDDGLGFDIRYQTLVINEDIASTLPADLLDLLVSTTGGTLAAQLSAAAEDQYAKDLEALDAEILSASDSRIFTDIGQALLDELSDETSGGNVRENVSDWLAAFASADVNIVGDDTSETLRGGTGDDTIDGLGGDDTLNGEAGNDVLLGRRGEDVLRGGDDDDRLFGGADDDTLSGNSGEDELSGGSGDDRLFGGNDDDTLDGENGDDTLDGGAGNDTLDGGDGLDDLQGGVGRDILLGRAGNDTIRGGDDNDRLFGGADDDLLSGNDGVDQLSGGSGDDRLFGGNDNDRLDGENGDDELGGGNGEDLLLGRDGGDLIRGNNGEDRLFGNDGDDTLSGGRDDDEVAGGLGDDRLFGGSGDDTLDGGFGADFFDGGTGADTFVFDSGDSGTTSATRDEIRGFSSGVDMIDLSGVFDGTLVFVDSYTGAAGEVRYNEDIGRLYVQIDGAGGSDFMIDLDGDPVLLESDLIL